MQLHFYGGAGSVTGSNHLLKIKRANILVDCGLFQGTSRLEKNNYLGTGQFFADLTNFWNRQIDAAQARSKDSLIIKMILLGSRKFN